MTGVSKTFPEGACDCHMHFYPPANGGEASELQSKTQSASIDDYRSMMEKLGVSRFVAVQSVRYGYDNSHMLKAMEAFGDSVRGIVTLPVGENTKAIKQLHKKKVRGVRAFMLENTLYEWDELPTLARLIEPFGWHLQLQINGRKLPDLYDRIKALTCPVVIDHNGKFIEPVVPEDHAFQTLLKLLDTDNLWVKMSAPYETSKDGPPRYNDVSVLARSLVKHRPDRLVWATNFPHPGFMPPPDDLGLANLLSDWAPDITTRDQILVDNPATLYDFDPIDGDPVNVGVGTNIEAALGSSNAEDAGE